MNDFGPWLFATAIIVCITLVFVMVPTSRRWFGISVGGIFLLVAAVLVSANFPSSPAKPWEKFQQQAGSSANPKLVPVDYDPFASPDTELVARLSVFPGADEIALLEAQIGKLPIVKGAGGKVEPTATIGDFTKASLAALDSGNTTAAKELITSLQRHLENRFLRFKLKR